MRANYNFVLENAKSIINRKKSDLEDARAIYYTTATLIEQTGAQGGDWRSVHKNQLCNLANIFFDREYALTGEKSQPYPDTLVNGNQTGEFQKIRKYMAVTASQLQCADIDASLSIETNAAATPTTSSSSTSLCGAPSGLLSTFTKPANWAAYKCQAGGNAKCLGKKDYVPADKLAQWKIYACPGNDVCCPVDTSAGSGTCPADFNVLSDSKYVYKCGTTAGTYSSCVKSSGVINEQNKKIPAGHDLNNKCPT
jgi:hypothetical protein